MGKEIIHIQTNFLCNILQYDDGICPMTRKQGNLKTSDVNNYYSHIPEKNSANKFILRCSTALSPNAEDKSKDFPISNSDIS